MCCFRPLVIIKSSFHLLAVGTNVEFFRVFICIRREHFLSSKRRVIILVPSTYHTHLIINWFLCSFHHHHHWWILLEECLRRWRRLVHVWRVICICYVFALIERTIFNVLITHFTCGHIGTRVSLTYLIVNRTSTLNHRQLNSNWVKNLSYKVRIFWIGRES